MRNGQAALEALIALAVMAAIASALITAVADAGVTSAIRETSQRLPAIRAAEAAVSESFNETLSRQWFWHGTDD